MNISRPSADNVLFQLSTTLPSLQEQGIDQLYPEPTANTSDSNDKDAAQPAPKLNHAYYLLKISKSLLLNFLEFVGALSVSPEQFESKVNDLRNLFINAHHLLNLYRPHQARESLIMMMEEQLQRSKDEIEQMDKVKAEIESALEQMQAQAGEVNPTETADKTASPTTKDAQKALEDARQVWDILDQEV